MEWTCARCGQCAAADDWALLTSIGWTLSSDGDCLCVSCLKPQGPTAAKLSFLPVPLGIRLARQGAPGPLQMREASAGRMPSCNGSEFRQPAPKARPHLVLVR